MKRKLKTIQKILEEAKWYEFLTNGDLKLHYDRDPDPYTLVIPGRLLKDLGSEYSEYNEVFYFHTSLYEPLPEPKKLFAYRHEQTVIALTNKSSEHYFSASEILYTRDPSYDKNFNQDNNNE